MQLIELSEINIQEKPDFTTYQGNVSVFGLQTNDFNLKDWDDTVTAYFKPEEFGDLIEKGCEVLGRPNLYIPKSFYEREKRYTETMVWVTARYDMRDFDVKNVSDYSQILWKVKEEVILKVERNNTPINKSGKVKVSLTDERFDEDEFWDDEE